MNIKLATGVFIIGSLLAPLAAHAEDADADRSHPMTFVKDSAITSKVKAKLAAEKIKSLVHIKVDTDSAGMVVLSGKVGTQEEADKAVSIAQGTEGVTSVTSHLRVVKHKDDADADRSHPMAFVKDSVITTKVKAKLAAEKIKSLVHIRVDTDSKGMVVLRGIVRSQEEADKAVSIAQGTEGVTSVTSKLRIKKDD
ncbi:MAG: BON domain-containing protein [Thiobacillaceae bacterium]|jgi:hyperosmotically inducible protein